MCKKLKALIAASSLAVLTPLLASYSDLQAVVAGSSGGTVTVSMHNPDSEPETACVELSVRLDDGTVVTLVSPSVTLAGGATTTITVVAPRSIQGIQDGPEPLPGI